jgi:hypothetical protein
VVQGAESCLHAKARTPGDVRQVPRAPRSRLKPPFHVKFGSMHWLIDNYKWLFDGIGVLVFAEVLRRVVARRRRPVPQPVPQPVQSETPRRPAQPQLKPLKFIEPFYYADGDSVPYCSRCWEAHQLQVHVAYQGRMVGGHRYDCPHCDYVYCSERIPAPR